MYMLWQENMDCQWEGSGWDLVLEAETLEGLLDKLTSPTNTDFSTYIIRDLIEGCTWRRIKLTQEIPVTELLKAVA